MRNVAIFIFDAVEVLDFAGPFEVFNVSAELISPSPFQVYTVGQTGGPIRARGGLEVSPHYSIDNCPAPDILLIPGGAGTRPLLKDEALLQWVKMQAARVELLLSVCTGALVLAQAGLLDGLQATTHHDNLDDLRRLAPQCTVLSDLRYVDNGHIITSAGVSAGIDMALHVVHRLLGDAVQITLQEMEYPWTPQA